MSASQQSRTSIFTPVLIGGSLILLINFALRASFGVFQIPIASEFGWPRAEFSMAIAIQNLAWGIGQPIFAPWANALATAGRSSSGAFLYSAGLVLTAYATTPASMQLLEVMVGSASPAPASASSWPSSAAPPATRTAALRWGSRPPPARRPSLWRTFGRGLLAVYPWQTVFIIFGVIILTCLLFLPLLGNTKPASRSELEDSMGTVLKRAFPTRPI